MSTPTYSHALAAALLVVTASVSSQDHSHGGMGKIGTVSFSTSCSALAQPQFNRGVALLHSFEFRGAIEAFDATLKADPSCRIAEWGIALSRWSNPFRRVFGPPVLAAGAQGSRPRERKIGGKTDRERDYVERGVAPVSRTTTRPRQPARVAAYRDAMARTRGRVSRETRRPRFSTRCRLPRPHHPTTRRSRSS